MKNETVISISNLSKCYRIYNSHKDKIKEALCLGKKGFHQKFWALKDISFEVKKGECLGIIGRNGSGKSTLLQVICGTLAPNLGSVEINGRVSALLELGAGFNPEFTGKENVYMNAAILGFLKDKIDEKYDEIIEFAEIGDFINQPVKTYSSGMYVRLAFSVAINVAPDILVIDEALAVGDDMFKRRCYRKIEDFQKEGKTIIFVSHDLKTVTSICHRAAVLDEGKIIDIGKPKDILNVYHKILAEKEKAYTQKTTAQKKGIEDDRFERIEKSSSEFRFGSGEAEILAYNILDKNGRETTLIESGEKYIIKITSLFKKYVEKPIIGINIKTVSGVLVFGINTLKAGTPIGRVNANEVVSVEFEVCFNLYSGSYILSAGVVEEVNSSIVPLDRRWDLVLLKIIGNNNFWGLTNLNTNVCVNRIAEN